MEKPIRNLNDWLLLLREAESGDVAAQLEVALHYDNGIIINGTELMPPDAQLAYKWTKSAYENGNLEASVWYADYLSNGEYCIKDTDLAMKLYEEAMKTDPSRAAFNLGIGYRDQHKFLEAFELYKKAGEGDLAVGMCYYYGIGVPQNRFKAFRFFERILQSDVMLSGYATNEANYMLGMMYLEGAVVKRSVRKARHYLLLANEDGDHRSAEQLLWIIGLKGKTSIRFS